MFPAARYARKEIPDLVLKPEKALLFVVNVTSF
jgi:hypothetical protein